MCVYHLKFISNSTVHLECMYFFQIFSVFFVFVSVYVWTLNTHALRWSLACETRTITQTNTIVEKNEDVHIQRVQCDPRWAICPPSTYLESCYAHVEHDGTANENQLWCSSEELENSIRHRTQLRNRSLILWPMGFSSMLGNTLRHLLVHWSPHIIRSIQRKCSENMFDCTETLINIRHKYTGFPVDILVIA